MPKTIEILQTYNANFVSTGYLKCVAEYPREGGGHSGTEGGGGAAP